MKCESRKNVSPFVPRLRHLSVFRVGNKTCASRQSRTMDARWQNVFCECCPNSTLHKGPMLFKVSLLFGPFWQLRVNKKLSTYFWAISEGVFFQLFAGKKKVWFFKKIYDSVRTKKLHNLSFAKLFLKLFLNYFLPQSRLPLKLNRECKAQRGFIYRHEGNRGQYQIQYIHHGFWFLLKANQIFFLV